MTIDTRTKVAAAIVLQTTITRQPLVPFVSRLALTYLPLTPSPATRSENGAIDDPSDYCSRVREQHTPVIRDGPYQQGRAERICESSPYEGAGDACEYCINGETDGCLGRGIACLELHLWRQRDEQSTYSTDSPDFTIDVAVPSSWTEQMSLRAMEISIKNNKCSVLYRQLYFLQVIIQSIACSSYFICRTTTWRLKR
jgi:hypothetical protein